MSGPHVHWDPRDADPLHVAERELDAWEAGYAAAIDGQRWRVAGLLLAGLSGAVVGAALMYAITIAAPRSGSLPPIPVAAAGQSGAPLGIGALDPGNGNQSGASPEASFDRHPRPSGAPMHEPSSITGIASWYDAGAGLYAAVPSWRWGDEPYRVRVGVGGRAVVVTVGDFCGCPGGRVIDLSADAFARLAPLSVGLVRVTVTRVGPGVTAPPTETER